MQYHNGHALLLQHDAASLTPFACLMAVAYSTYSILGHLVTGQIQADRYISNILIMLNGCSKLFCIVKAKGPHLLRPHLL